MNTWNGGIPKWKGWYPGCNSFCSGAGCWYYSIYYYRKMRFLIIFLFRGVFLCIVLLHTEERPPSCAGYILCLLRKCQERGRKEKKKSISSGCLSRFAGSWGLAWHHPSSSSSLLFLLFLFSTSFNTWEATTDPVGGKITSELFSRVISHCVFRLVLHRYIRRIFVLFFCGLVSVGGGGVYLFCSPEEER